MEHFEGISNIKRTARNDYFLVFEKELFLVELYNSISPKLLYDTHSLIIYAVKKLCKLLSNIKG